MAKPSTIYAVDDDPNAIEIIKHTLENDECVIKGFTNPQQCLEQVRADIPDLVIVDVDMPELNGFTLCELIRKEKALDCTPVIFVSAMDGMDDIQHGYDSGGMDYITKPFRPQELKSKIQANLTAHLQLLALKKKATNAKKTAFDAMNDAERLSAITHFMEETVRLKDFGQIAKKLFNILLPQQLRTCVLFCVAGEEYYFSDDDIEHPLERKLLSKTHEALPALMEKSSRFYPFKGRMIVCFEHVTILIRNYNELEHRPLMDFIGGLLNGVEIKMYAIHDSVQQAAKRRQEADKHVRFAEDTLKELKTTFKSYEKMLLGIMDQLMGDMNISFASLGLL